MNSRQQQAHDRSAKAKIAAGIAAYAQEQKIILRLLRKRGSFTERDFDAWLKGRDFKRPRLYRTGITHDTYILGIGRNGGTQWARWIELMQYMVHLGIIDAKKENGLVVYRSAKC